MLQGLRAASQSRIGRVLMGLVMGFIALSFAIWGIGDVFRGSGSGRLVKVGSGEVTVDAYRAAYQNEIRRLQQRARRAITNEEARRFGIDQQVLERLVSEAVLDQKTRSMGLAISEDETTKLLKEETVFQGPGGRFDAERFKAIVRDAGYTERGFVVEQKSVYLRKALTDAVISGMEPPRVMLEAIHRFRNEARAIDYFLLPAAKAGDIAAPSAEELQKYYADREDSFRAKEYRKLAILNATPGTLAKPGSVSDDDARKLYEEVKLKRFGTPEKRELRQLVFKTRQEAEEALAKLKGGQRFEALAAERKLTEKDIDLGLVEAKDLGDPKLAGAVFAPKKPGFSEPVQTAFGVVIFEVRKIAPATVAKGFEQARDELKREIAAERAAPEVRKIHDAIEDQRAAGKPLAEAAKASGLDVATIEATDAEGRDKLGKDVAAIGPGGADLLKAAFASDVGVDNDTVATKDGGFTWFEVAAVEPARQRGFDEVKTMVEQALRTEKLQKALTDKANELAEKLRAGQSIEKLAKDLGLELKRATDVKRAQRQDLPASAIVAMFEVQPRNPGSAAVEGGRIVFFVKDAATPAFDASSIEAKTIAEQMRAALANDVLEQYIGALEKIYNVDVNQKALQAAIGTDAGQ